MNKTLKTSALAIALAGGGAIGVGSLAAASYGDEPPTLDEPVGDDTVNETPDGEPGDPAAPGEGRRGHRAHGNSEVAAEALGITTDELHEAGQALTDDAQTRIAEKVAEGELTQEEADERLAGLDERITERLNQAPGEGGRRGQRGVRNSEAVAEALGVTTDDLQAASESGQSLADVATAQGVSIDAVVDLIVEGVETHLAEEVEGGPQGVRSGRPRLRARPRHRPARRRTPRRHGSRREHANGRRRRRVQRRLICRSLN